MIFEQQAIFKIVGGTKTQTRRLAQGKPPRYRVGRDYAVTAGRNLPTVYYFDTAAGRNYHFDIRDGNASSRSLDAIKRDLERAGCIPLRIRILRQSTHDIRMISQREARLEGFLSANHFKRWWISRYDSDCQWKHYWYVSIHDRPAELYIAHAYTFEVVREN